MAKRISAATKATLDFKATAIAEFRAIENLTKEYSGTIQSRRIAFLDMLITQYGASLIKEAKDGGFDGNKMKSPEGIAEQAGKHGITAAALTECASIIAEVKKEGPFKWRDYLRAKFPAAKAEKGESTKGAARTPTAEKTGPDVATLVAKNPQEARKVISILVASLTEACAKRKAGKLGTVRLQAAIKFLQDADNALMLDGTK